MTRLHTLDYLRGIAAAGIMVFHYTSWTFGEYDSDSFMGRVGIYGVAIFYILSGLTLYHVYAESLADNLAQLKEFFKRRVLRIFPLLWLATIISIFTVYGGGIAFSEILLNLTGLFGFVHWSGGIAIGAWSIGNELVFYCFLPLFVFLHKKNALAFWGFSFIILCVYLYFAYFLINPDLTFADYDQRQYYFNPLNHVFLFLAGYLIGVLLKKVSLTGAQSSMLIFFGLILLIFYPAHGSRIALVAGNARMAFTASCILICLGFYKFSIALPSFISWPLRTLGEISYSVYMLHPIVHLLVKYPIDFLRAHFFPISEAFRFFSAICLTLLISYFVYHHFEKYFIRLGKPTTR